LKNLRERDLFGNTDIDERMILRWIFRRSDVGLCTDRAGSGEGKLAGTCEWGNETSGSIKCG